MVYDALFAYLRFAAQERHKLACQGGVMSTADTTRASVGAQTSTFGEFFKVWLKIGLINFGGPAGQIAMMHRIVVDEKKWIEEQRFPARAQLLHAAAGAGGAEARDLYRLAAARRARRARVRHPVRAAGRVGGDVGLSLLYALGRGVPLIDGALFGIKAAVLVIVMEALWRIGKRALKTELLIALSRPGVRRHFLPGAAVSLIVGALPP